MAGDETDLLSLVENYSEEVAFHAWEDVQTEPSTSNGKDRDSLPQEACDSAQAFSGMEPLVALPALHPASSLTAEEEGRVCDRVTSVLDSAEVVSVHSSHSCTEVQGLYRSFDHMVGLPWAWEEAVALAYSTEKSCSDYDHPSCVASHIPLSAIFPAVALRRCPHRPHSADHDSGVVEDHGSVADAGYNTDLADCSLPYSMKR